jgi:hypothetical protein
MARRPVREPLPADLRARLELLTSDPVIRRFPGLLTRIVLLVCDAYERDPAAGFRAQLDAMISRTYDEAWADQGRRRGYRQGLLAARDLCSGTGVVRLPGDSARASALSLEQEPESAEDAALADDDSEIQADAAQVRSVYTRNGDRQCGKYALSRT